MSTNQSCNCNHAKCFHIATIVLLVATIATSLWAGCQITKMETLKVGGKENFAKLQTIMKSNEYKEQYAQSLDLMLQQLNGSDDMFNDEMMINEANNNETTTSGELEITLDPSSSNDSVVNEDTLPITDQNETIGE